MRLITWILGTATLVAVGLVIVLNVMGADVVLTNAGTQTVRVRGALPSAAESALSVAGVRVPEELQPGVPAVVRVPRLSGIVAAAPGAIDLSVLGQTLHIAASCDRLDMNGASLLGRSTNFELAEGSRTEVHFACH
jgi:hypothetical protein